ncbi:hypothetical protein BGW37DRAFT_114338 [Umbelopsis sp. PMI_123]|nr:hypothetical protein BGW37DRAFT_114338 [Umbelopsis sp. PMI_123]
MRIHQLKAKEEKLPFQQKLKEIEEKIAESDEELSNLRVSNYIYVQKENIPVLNQRLNFFRVNWLTRPMIVKSKYEYSLRYETKLKMNVYVLKDSNVLQRSLRRHARYLWHLNLLAGHGCLSFIAGMDYSSRSRIPGSCHTIKDSGTTGA